MAKTGPNFKLSKTTKRRLSTMVNAEARNHWKRCMIDAEHSASIIPKTNRKERQGGSYTTTSNSATPSAE